MLIEKLAKVEGYLSQLTKKQVLLSIDDIGDSVADGAYEVTFFAGQDTIGHISWDVDYGLSEEIVLYRESDLAEEQLEMLATVGLYGFKVSIM